MFKSFNDKKIKIILEDTRGLENNTENQKTQKYTRGHYMSQENTREHQMTLENIRRHKRTVDITYTVSGTKLVGKTQLL